MTSWIEIDLDAILENYRTACALAQGGAEITCVLKANAYGHGAVPVALALQQAGCRSFAVSCDREALELRRHGIAGDILVMTPAETPDRLVAAGAVLTAASAEDLARAEAAAAAQNRIAQVQLKLDSGFHRLGFPCDGETVSRLAGLIPSLPHVRVTGAYTHLALARADLDARQVSRFRETADALEAAGIPLPDRHVCDSIGLARYPQWHMSRCRVGAFLFGSCPKDVRARGIPCRESLRFLAPVTQVTDVAAGETVGYDEALTDRPVRVATVQAGYGDGYPRSLSGGRGKVSIRGRRCPVVGLVCMDQMMVDVSAVPDCRAGDTAELLGGAIPYDEMADWADTNRNECLTILSRRPVRRYYRDGLLAAEWDMLAGDFDGAATAARQEETT